MFNCEHVLSFVPGNSNIRPLYVGGPLHVGAVQLV